MARSRLASVKSTSSSAATKVKRVSGFALLNVANRAASHLAVKSRGAAMVSELEDCPACIARTDSSNCRKPARRASRPFAASSVSSSPLGVRRKRTTPNISSSARICCPTAAGVTASSSAALVKLKCRAEASSTRRPFKGRCVRFTSLKPHPFASSVVEMPLSCARPKDVSTSLDTNGCKRSKNSSRRGRSDQRKPWNFGEKCRAIFTDEPILPLHHAAGCGQWAT